MSAEAIAKLFRLEGQTAVITGASRGLGREIAETLASAGAQLVLNARDEMRLSQAVREIAAQFGVCVTSVAGDLASPGVAEAIVERSQAEFGRLDILVNNAGINIRGAIEEVSPEDFDRVMAVNVKGPWLLCRAAASLFRRQSYGRVINVASTLGLVARTDRSLYCVSKGAIVQLTRELAVEWAEIGVTVNAVCPGPFKTEMNQALVANPETYRLFAGYTAMKRWGERGEIGPAVLFFASPSASYVTGAILPVDGGWVVKS